ncbi:MAG: VWA domain-containing protein [Acidobacteriota bacterium]|jgi:VWFA-related protein|nr:VWA domain-containing protein [Acidobacteriota bacterium]NLT33203.1 VWA domain-containing protein [Acidobacteriota bacterium]
MTTRKILGACLLAAALAALAPGQTPQGETDLPQAGFKIGVEVNMVNVPVTVRGADGDFVRGLPQDSFRLLEDGQPQEILFFAQEGLPVHIAIVLDNSGSVRSEWGAIRYATRRFIEQLKPGDRFSLTSFNTEIRLKMDWGTDTARLDPVLTSIYCKGNTKVWDAVWVVCNDVFRGVEGKKAMIIMSDGMDNESAVTYEEALEAAVQAEVAVYVVSKTEALRQLALTLYREVPQKQFLIADQALRKLAYATGGRVLYPNNFGQLDDIYADVDEELRNQYTLGYVSDNTDKDGSYRQIEVRVARPGVSITARPGYYAPRE